MTKEAQDRIRKNIAQSERHIYVVAGGQTPRFAYTIGVSESVGVELILAGAIFYMKDEAVKILNEVAAQLGSHRNREPFELVGMGSFTLRKVHSSWASEIM